MKNLKRQLLFSGTLLLTLCRFAPAAPRSGEDLVLTKEHLGATGHAALASARYSLGFAWGEAAAGHYASNAAYALHSGFYAGGFSNGSSLVLLHSEIGRPGDRRFYQGTLQVGVSLSAPVVLTFSDALDEQTIQAGITASVIRNHEGLPEKLDVPIEVSYDRAARTVTVVSSQPWTGNTLYDISISTHIVNLDSAPLDQPYHLYFVTLLDPALNNVVLNPAGPEALAASGLGSSGQMSMHLPEGSLSDYSAVLLNPDPFLSPIRINPALIEEANTKARAAGGAYRQPLSVQEIAAFNRQGEPTTHLRASAGISMSYGGSALLSSGQGIIRPQTLAIWALDEEHRLWVKLPASRHSSDQTLTAPVSRFSVFALMGTAAGSATDSYAFPNPWRPGPDLTFTNLPSECVIRIYTLSGEEVRELKHSDLNGLLGQEKWDVKTPGGKPVASGIYLWQVESSEDHKNGKLMVIR